MGLTMNNPGARVEISTDRSNGQRLIGLPIPLGQNSGTVTADIYGWDDFKRGIV
jgi:hypothetical protein